MTKPRCMVIPYDDRARILEEMVNLTNSEVPQRLVLVQLDDNLTLRRKRLHDLGGALARVQGIIAVLEAGISISDEQRLRFAALLRSAHEALSEELTTWEQLYL